MTQPVSAPGVVFVGTDLATAGLSRLAALHEGRARGEGIVLPPGAGCVAIATCNRLEVYAHHVTDAEAMALFEGWVGGVACAEFVTIRHDDAAAAHLLRVAAGLESAVLGEDQILTQLRSAYRAANAAGLTRGPLHRLFHVAFRVGRRVRAETPLASGVRSLSGAAVALVHRRLGSLRDKSALVLGAGEMARLAARALADRDPERLIVANRTPERAAALAADVGGEHVPWEWRASTLPLVDVVICATSASERVLDPGALAAAGRGRETPLFVADLGVPPNVDPVGADGVEVLDMATFAAVLGAEADARREAVASAEGIIAEELPDWPTRVAPHGACSRACGARCRVG